MLCPSMPRPGFQNDIQTCSRLGADALGRCLFSVWLCPKGFSMNRVNLTRAAELVQMEGGKDGQVRGRGRGATNRSKLQLRMPRYLLPHTSSIYGLDSLVGNRTAERSECHLWHTKHLCCSIQSLSSGRTVEHCTCFPSVCFLADHSSGSASCSTVQVALTLQNTLWSLPRIRAPVSVALYRNVLFGGAATPPGRALVASGTLWVTKICTSGHDLNIDSVATAKVLSSLQLLGVLPALGGLHVP